MAAPRWEPEQETIVAGPGSYLPAYIGPLETVQPWLDQAETGRLVTVEFSTATGCTFQSDITPPALSIQQAARNRRIEYMAGRLCAQQALRLLNGCRNWPGRNIDGTPVWPENTVGSISHCEGRAIAWVGQHRYFTGLGIDLERPFDPQLADELAPMIQTENERHRWRGNSDPFLKTLTFSLKESAFKALYPLAPRPFSFCDTELIEWHPEGTAILRLQTDFSKDWYAGRQLIGCYRYLGGFLLTQIDIRADDVHVLTSAENE